MSISLSKSRKLVTLGSVNIDHILNLDHFPHPGETVSGNQYRIAFGGKGANQAVAAGRAGADITFLACIGADDPGKNILRQFREDGIQTDCIKRIEDEATGTALIFVNAQGENIIGINAGANACLNNDYVEYNRKHIEQADILLMQLETPLDSIRHAARIARDHHTYVILNPAPAQKLDDELLATLDMITPNETEIEILTGIKILNDEDADKACSILHEKGVGTVIITLGSRGAWISEQNKEGYLLPGFKVSAVDTIAAGDTFNGSLATALLEGLPLDEAVRFAHAAAAIAVTRRGAQPSVPWRHEIDAFLKEKL
jgi:ribokinase